MAAMLHARNNAILFLRDKMFILMQNIFIVPSIQHGRHAKPLLPITYCIHIKVKKIKKKREKNYEYHNRFP